MSTFYFRTTPGVTRQNWRYHVLNLSSRLCQTSPLGCGKSNCRDSGKCTAWTFSMLVTWKSSDAWMSMQSQRLPDHIDSDRFLKKLKQKRISSFCCKKLISKRITNFVELDLMNTTHVSNFRMTVLHGNFFVFNFQLRKSFELLIATHSFIHWRTNRLDNSSVQTWSFLSSTNVLHIPNYEVTHTDI